MPTLSERLGANITTVHANSRVAKALASQGVAKTFELMRVVGLPRRVFDASMYPDASVLYAKSACGRKGCPYCANGDPTLKLIQNAMIIEAAQNSGGFFNVGVGQGKTLASFLIHDAIEANRTVLLVPAQLKTKTLEIDLPELRLHFKLPPIYRADEYQGQTGVFVIGYEELSETKASDLLDKIRPDCIVADEAHKLRNAGAARTKRFLRFCRHNAVKFVAMTGSAMSKSILDFAHLIELALGKNSPLPADYPSKVQWSDCIDKGNTEIGALSLLCDDTESAREGFQRRFRETPGVIATIESAAQQPIELRLFKLVPPTSVVSALQALDKDWAWDGEEYSLTLEVLRVERQLAQGFFYRPIWPNGVKDREWLQKRSAWQKAIRTRLKHTNRTGQDSPALLEALAEEGLWTPPEWVDWLTVRDRPEPDKEAIEISRWLVEKAIAWRDNFTEPGIIWVDSPVIGEWLAQTGIAFYGEGQDDEVNELADYWLRQKQAGTAQGQPTIALSMRSHGTGKNLQAWSRNLVLYPPASSEAWEQMIGRTHRPGQIDEVVTFDVILACASAESAMDSALEYSKANEEKLGTPHKLNTVVMCPEDWRFEDIPF